jgi:phytoene desaturase
LAEAAYKYEKGINKLVHKPEDLLLNLLTAIFSREYLSWMFLHQLKNTYINILKSPRLRQLMEFPVLFLGALPENTPALYSLMNYADIKGGTWYPQGGMYSVVKAMYELALNWE